MTGTVTHTQKDGLIVAKMDQPVEGGKFWDNELWWYGRGPQFELDTEPMSQPTATP
jgi:hypothetical protein